APSVPSWKVPGWYVVQTQPSRAMVRRWTSPTVWVLSHSTSTGSLRDASAWVGNGAPSIQSGCGTPATAQNVGARSTWPTGSDTTAGGTPAEGAGRQIN